MNPLDIDCTQPGCGALAGQNCNWLEATGTERHPREEFHPERYINAVKEEKGAL